MRISIKTLGCKANQSESSFIEGSLRREGYEIVDYDENPDLCIVNTCTVTSKADYQSRQLIRRAIRNGAKVIATGCYAQLRADEISNIEGAISVIGNSDKGNIIENINRLFNQKGKKVGSLRHGDSFFSGLYYSERARAFLKIQDGCNNSCSYCTIPMARGRSRSLPFKDVLSLIGDLYISGYREVVITGIHIGSYGADLSHRVPLSEVIKESKALYPDLRLRLSSIEPDEFNEGLLSVISNNLICPHLHIPIQSGSDKVLKDMNRRYDRGFIKELINTIISINPDISIGTDVIVGFPGEGDEEFKETYKLIEELPLSYIHVFPYSKRPGTQAESLPNHVSYGVKKHRAGSLMGLAKKKKIDYISRYKNKILDVIIEGNDITTGLYKGISSNYIRVLVKGNGLRPHTRILAKGISFNNETLICEPVKIL